MTERKIDPGWYPYDDHQQAYWDGENWTEHRAPIAPKRKDRTPSWRVWLACVAVIGALVAVWSLGTFDEFLAEFGLNAKPCAENVLTGNKLCGDELDAFCASQLGSHSDAC